MSKIVAFGASSSSQSINRKLATWASAQVNGSEVDLLDLNDFEMPVYSMDKEQASGIPEKAQQFKAALKGADGILISFAEHNGSYSSAFKNIFDWMSRLEKPIWCDKPMFLLSSSPGPRGGQNVLATASGSFPHQGGQVVASFSLPSFNQNFVNEQIADSELKGLFDIELAKFEVALNSK